MTTEDAIRAREFYRLELFGGKHHIEFVKHNDRWTTNASFIPEDDPLERCYIAELTGITRLLDAQADFWEGVEVPAVATAIEQAINVVRVNYGYEPLGGPLPEKTQAEPPVLTPEQFEAQARAAFEAGLAGKKIDPLTGGVDWASGKDQTVLQVCVGGQPIDPNSDLYFDLLSEAVFQTARKADPELGPAIDAIKVRLKRQETTPERTAEQVALSNRIVAEVLAEEKRMKVLEAVASAAKALLRQVEADASGTGRDKLDFNDLGRALDDLAKTP